MTNHIKSMMCIPSDSGVDITQLGFHTSYNYVTVDYENNSDGDFDFDILVAGDVVNSDNTIAVLEAAIVEIKKNQMAIVLESDDD